MHKKVYYFLYVSKDSFFKLNRLNINGFSIVQKGVPFWTIENYRKRLNLSSSSVNDKTNYFNKIL